MPDMYSQPLKIIQITDCHLDAIPATPILGMDPDTSLSDVLSLINQHHAQHDLLIATGDLANNPALAVYQRLHTQLEQHLSTPFAWLPGNHDDPELMHQLGPSVNLKVHDMGAWVVVLLNSRLAGQVKGYLSVEELTFLQTTLEQHRHKHIMVCLHHQPVPIDSRWMDQYIVSNAEDFWAVIDQAPQVKLVLWGHVHQAFSSTRNGTQLLATPSTCIQFTPEQDDFAVDNTMPGYRWLELYEDGRINTGVKRVPLKDYGIDFESSGY